MSQSRRNFIAAGLGFVFMLPFASCSPSINNPDNCTTSDDILGPFYRANAPQRNDLNAANATGTKLNINGTVYGVNCSTVLANTKIEIWHADHSGAYDNTSSDFNFRATFYSDNNGHYNFSTILPGKYLNGSKYRPSHIHFKVTANDHTELVTQLYFEGDTDIASDPWASDNAAKKRVIPLTTDSQGAKTGTFDIILAAK